MRLKGILQQVLPDAEARDSKVREQHSQDAANRAFRCFQTRGSTGQNRSGYRHLQRYGCTAVRGFANIHATSIEHR